MNPQSTSKMKLEEIETDDRIYPRERFSDKNFELLVEKLKAGEKLDPLTVQEVKEDGSKKTISLDGKHRIQAYKEFNKLEDYGEIKKVKVKHYKNKTLDFEEHRDELLIKSYQLNDSHGLNVKSRDVKKTARILRKRNPEWTAKKIGKELNRDKSTIHEHIKDIIQEQKASEKSLIMRLDGLGFRHKEIANHEEITVSRPRVSQIVNNFDIGKINDKFQNGKSAEEISKFYDIDLQTAWSIILDRKSDIDRFRTFGESEHGDKEPMAVDKWEFPHSDPRIGRDYPGQLDGQVVLNILYYHTEQGDFVVDVFAGGGSTIDACLIMGRKCRAYDVNPSRMDVFENDIRNGYPKEAKGADMIVLDPPYGDKMIDDYGKNGFTEDRETIMENMENLVEESYKILGKNGKVALIFGNHKGQKGNGDIWAPDLYQLFKNNGFETEYIYHVPSKGYPSPSGRLQQKTRDLYIFVKNEN